MDRFERYGFYVRGLVTGRVRKKTPREAWAAEALGIRHYRGSGANGVMMSVNALDEELARLGVLPKDDEPDGDAEDRDARQLADAQARLAKLLEAGGVRPAGGSLCDAAADEIARLREHIAVLGKEEAYSDGLVSKLKTELQQAKEALEQARAKEREAREEVVRFNSLVGRAWDALGTPASARGNLIGEIERARSGAAELRSPKAPAAASMEPRKGIGEENATAGSSSVPEEAPGGQGLPKPARVEVGQRWRADFMKGPVVVVALGAEGAWLRGERGVSIGAASARAMLEQDAWTFLGMAPTPGTGRDGEAVESRSPLISVGTVYFASREGTPEELSDLVASLTRHLRATLDGHGSDRGDVDLLANADGSVRVEMPRAADPRAVLATVAELLGIGSAEERHLMQQIDREEAFLAGIAEGERRAKAKAAELVTRWTGRMKMDRGANPTAGDAYAWHRLQGSADSIEQCRGEARAAFGLPVDQPPTGGEPGPDEPTRCSVPGCQAPHHAAPADARPKLAAGQRWRKDGFEIAMRKRTDISAGFSLDAVFPTGVYLQFNEGESAPENWTLVSDAPPVDTDERWQPGAVWDQRGRQRTVGLVFQQQGMMWVHFRNEIGPELCDHMTTENGWRYVGRGEAQREPGPHGEHLNTAIARDFRGDIEKAARAFDPGETKTIERAHADGIVEGLRRASVIVKDRGASGSFDLDLINAFERADRDDLPGGFAPAASPARTVLDEIAEERRAQDAKWGGPEHDDEHGQPEWLDFIADKTRKAQQKPDGRRRRLIQIAALAVAAVESMDRLAGRDAQRALPTDRQPPVDRAALLALAEGWETRAATQVMSPPEEHALIECAAALRRLLDAPRGPGGGEREAGDRGTPPVASAGDEPGPRQASPGGAGPSRWRGIEHEVAPCRVHTDEWIVEAIDLGSEGEVYAARFSGPGAEERASAYAAWASTDRDPGAHDRMSIGVAEVPPDTRTPEEKAACDARVKATLAHPHVKAMLKELDRPVQAFLAWANGPRGQRYVGPAGDPARAVARGAFLAGWRARHEQKPPAMSSPTSDVGGAAPREMAGAASKIHAKLQVLGGLLHEVGRPSEDPTRLISGAMKLNSEALSLLASLPGDGRERAQELAERWRDRAKGLCDITAGAAVSACAFELSEAFGLDPEGADHEPQRGEPPRLVAISRVLSVGMGKVMILDHGTFKADPHAERAFYGACVRRDPVRVTVEIVEPDGDVPPGPGTSADAAQDGSAAPQVIESVLSTDVVGALKRVGWTPSVAWTCDRGTWIESDPLHVEFLRRAAAGTSGPSPQDGSHVPHGSDSHHSGEGAAEGKVS